MPANVLTTTARPRHVLKHVVIVFDKTGAPPPALCRSERLPAKEAAFLFCCDVVKEARQVLFASLVSLLLSTRGFGPGRRHPFFARAKERMQRNTPELLARHSAGSLRRKDERRQNKNSLRSDSLSCFSALIHSTTAASLRGDSQIHSLMIGGHPHPSPGSQPRLET